MGRVVNAIIQCRPISFFKKFSLKSTSEMHPIFLLLFLPFIFALDHNEFYYMPGSTAPKEFLINARTSFEIFYEPTDKVNPSRIIASCANATTEFPVLVVVQQIQHVTSWQIPLLVESSQGTIEYNYTARTLCELNRTTGNVEPTKLVITLSTFSPKDITVLLEIKPQETYNIETEGARNVSFSASEPIFYSYSFPDAANDSSDTINTVQIRTFSADDVCFTVSVQTKQCPVYDLNDDIQFQGRYLSVNRKAALTITRNRYPNGFVLVFVAHPDNHLCNSEDGKLKDDKDDIIVLNRNRTSEIFFEIIPSKSTSNYLDAIFGLLGINLAACLLTAILTYSFYKCGNYYKPLVQNSDDAIPREGNTIAPNNLDYFLSKGELRNSKKADHYFWHILHMAVFYGLPVVQLMLAYQRAVDYSGDLDLCYHNTFCSHPYYFTDFNHIYSNIGYVLFGILFLIIMVCKEYYLHRPKNCGIPRYFGIYYAMGGVLILEGICSALYHICPSQANFQFDTSFMYVICLLMLVKLYQNRHPDITATAYVSFSILGYFLIIAIIGILHNHQYIRIVFFLLHILLCLHVSFKLYYDADKDDSKKTFWNWLREGKHFRILNTEKFVFLIIGNIINWAIFILGILSNINLDFGSLLLFLLIANSIYYCFYYSYKKVKLERLCIQSIIYGLIAFTLWVPALIYFSKTLMKWQFTPANSRMYNEDCSVLGFYDYHDIWHILSAPALFYTFMFLSALDDDQYDKPQSKIAVF